MKDERQSIMDVAFPTRASLNKHGFRPSIWAVTKTRQLCLHHSIDRSIDPASPDDAAHDDDRCLTRLFRFPSTPPCVLAWSIGCVSALPRLLHRRVKHTPMNDHANPQPRVHMSVILYYTETTYCCLLNTTRRCRGRTLLSPTMRGPPASDSTPSLHHAATIHLCTPCPVLRQSTPPPPKKEEKKDRGERPLHPWVSILPRHAAAATAAPPVP